MGDYQDTFRPRLPYGIDDEEDSVDPSQFATQQDFTKDLYQPHYQQVQPLSLGAQYARMRPNSLSGIIALLASGNEAGQNQAALANNQIETQKADQAIKMAQIKAMSNYHAAQMGAVSGKGYTTIMGDDGQPHQVTLTKDGRIVDAGAAAAKPSNAAAGKPNPWLLNGKTYREDPDNPGQLIPYQIADPNGPPGTMTDAGAVNKPGVAPKPAVGHYQGFIQPGEGETPATGVTFNQDTGTWSQAPLPAGVKNPIKPGGPGARPKPPTPAQTQALTDLQNAIGMASDVQSQIKAVAGDHPDTSLGGELLDAAKTAGSNLAYSKLGVTNDRSKLIQQVALLKATRTAGMLKGVRNQMYLKQIWSHMPDEHKDSIPLMQEKLDYVTSNMKKLYEMEQAGATAPTEAAAAPPGQPLMGPQGSAASRAPASAAAPTHITKDGKMAFVGGQWVPNPQPPAQ